MNWASYRKGIVAAVGLVAQALAAGLLTGTAATWAQVLLAIATALGVYGVPNEPLPLARPRSDGGYARQVWRPLVTLTLTLALLTLALRYQQISVAYARPAPAAPSCPAGYFRADVRIGGQRLETGLDPVTHAEQLEVTQNAPAASPPDRRYVAASVCVRPLTAAERLAQFHEGVQP